MTKRATTALADEALDAFWEVIARRFPQARFGDLSIDRTIRLQCVAEEAIAEWIDNNVPDASDPAPEAQRST
jgi:hypothetical protein